MTITTMIPVKTRANRVHPPSDRVFTCRKKMVWTMIWAMANRVTSMPVIVGARTPDMTSQNGMAVSTTDSRKPTT